MNRISRRRALLSLGALLTVAGVATLTPSLARATPPDPSDPEFAAYVLNRVDDLHRGRSSHATMTMHVKTDRWERTMTMEAWSLGEDYSLVRILEPKKERGTATLKAKDDLFTYLSKTGRTIKISGASMGGSWMGSHFTNDDLVKETQLQKHFTSRIIETHKGELGSLGSGTFYRLRLDPKPTAPVAWGKIVYELWEGGPIVVPVRATYFRKVSDKKPTRTMSFSEMKKMSGRTMPCVMSITVTDKPGEYTKITYRKVKFDIAIPGAKFTEQALRN